MPNIYFFCFRHPRDLKIKRERDVYANDLLRYETNDNLRPGFFSPKNAEMIFLIDERIPYLCQPVT